MADLDVSPDKITEARKAGYTDDEIVQHLSTQAPDKFGAALKEGYTPSEILQHIAPQPSGFIDSAKQGAADVVGGVGRTIAAHLGEGPVGTLLQNAGNAIAPADFKQAPLIDSNGIHPSNIPARLVQMAPSMTAALIAARATPGPWWAKLAGGAGAGFLMGAGDAAQTAADTRTGTPNSPITGADLVRGDLTSAAASAAAAAPITRFFPGSGVVGATGAKGVVDALKRYATNAGMQGAATGASDAITQAGQTVGTKGGLNVNPAKVADAAAGGAVTGGLFGGNNLARESLNATKYSGITPELRPAATQFANRIQQAAGDENLNAGRVFAGGAQRAGAEAFNKAHSAVQSELGSAVDDLKSRVTLPVDANNVINSALKGQQPSAHDYATLENAVRGDPQADNVMNLLRQAHVADIVKNTGSLSEGKFSGGITGAVGAQLTGEHAAKTALVGLGGAAFEGGAGHLIAYSPEIMGALAAAKTMASMADHITGARAPAGRFVKGFADGSTPVRAVVPQAPAPVAPIVNRVGPTGPSVPLPATPWGVQRAAPAVTPTLPKVLPTEWLNKMRANYDAQEAAKAQVNASPYIEQKVGSAGNVPTPAAAKEMAKAVSAANVLAKLQSDPAAQAEEKVAAKEEAARTKATAKAAVISAKAAAKAPAISAPNNAPLDLPSFLRSQAAAEPPALTKVTKANGKIGTEHTADEYVVPSSPYAHLVPSEAAKKILADAQAGPSPPKYPAGFQKGIIRNLSAIRDRASAAASEVPGLNAKAIAAQFEGVDNQKDAIRHRDWLKKQMPQAAAALDKFFTDADIKSIWKRVGK